MDVLHAEEDRPRTKYLNRHVREQVCSSPDTWYDLGVELLHPDIAGQLDVIKANEGGDTKKCFRAMIKLWFQTQSGASWKQLITALEQLDLNSLANTVKSLLLPKEDILEWAPLSVAPLVSHYIISLARVVSSP